MLDFFVKHRHWLLLLFTVGYFVTFTVNALIQGNLEFLYYTALMTLLIFITIAVNRRVHLGFFIIFNLSLLGFVHLLGGNYYVGETRLYDYLVFGVLKYDNIVHTFGTFTITFVLYSMLSDFISLRLQKNFPVVAFGLVLMAIGAGTINELIEFFAVVFLGAAEQVGDYFNNALDLLFNTIGSVLATIIIYLYRQRPAVFRELPKDE